MKKFVLISLAVIASISVIALFSFKEANNPEKGKTAITAAKKVEVFYFHFTRRCVTCQAVEDESRKAVESLYPDQVKKGTVTFEAINLDDESSKTVAERCKVSGQSLLIISGEARIDLTSEGFMNARSNPEKLKEELKKAIDPLLTGNK
jgi:hypothetical protein